jgi:hypothetical protein
MDPRVDHLHWELTVSPRDTLEITVDQPANVLLMDDAEYRKYCKGEPHQAYGGPVEKGATILKPYRNGLWHVVVDMGRSGGKVNASVKNRTTNQPLGAPQGRQLRGVATGTLEYRADKSL